jgi:hypothetical protein
MIGVPVAIATSVLRPWCRTRGEASTALAYLRRTVEQLVYKEEFVGTESWVKSRRGGSMRTAKRHGIHETSRHSAR